MRIRPERVGHLMRREIADILTNRLRDPRLGHWVSVTDVEVTDTVMPGVVSLPHGWGHDRPGTRMRVAWRGPASTATC